jgi:hypothetical protein
MEHAEAARVKLGPVHLLVKRREEGVVLFQAWLRLVGPLVLDVEGADELGATLDVSRGLDDGRQPVDRDVFTRELDYYQIRSASSGAESSGAK